MSTISSRFQKIQFRNFSSAATIDGIPVTFIISKLHQLGPVYLDDKSTSFAELYVNGIERPFWVHKEWLILQSSFFQNIFETIKTNNSIIRITVPSPENFESLLEFLYDGDSDKLYDTLTQDNYYSVWKNIEYLGLGPEIRAICIAFYQNQVDST
ncbi:7183_t:CDS:1 [Funneliformis geosporum]|uniref:4376_t:CDS:1 n=1 Tax=Funneliformis geosporum TaxID=1117311 RepID=A0A9W4WJX0_9GLOM|nr:4376_t:CDS:1 [Funneliformis geosporum]CAI2169004.1 7183_t:CDS:1 [Funneliformis geosporum]